MQYRQTTPQQSAHRQMRIARAINKNPSTAKNMVIAFKCCGHAENPLFVAPPNAVPGVVVGWVVGAADRNIVMSELRNVNAPAVTLRSAGSAPLTLPAVLARFAAKVPSPTAARSRDCTYSEACIPSAKPRSCTTKLTAYSTLTSGTAALK